MKIRRRFMRGSHEDITIIVCTRLVGRRLSIARFPFGTVGMDIEKWLLERISRASLRGCFCVCVVFASSPPTYIVVPACRLFFFRVSCVVR